MSGIVPSGAVVIALILAAGPAESAAWRSCRDVSAMGWSREKLAEAAVLAGEIGAASVMVVQQGTVLAAWGQVDRPMPVYSMRKGLYNALYGVAVAEGEIDLKATLVSFGVDDLGGLTEAEKLATVEDLLSARSGIYHASAYEPASMKGRRPERGSHAPGEFWFYNNWDFNVAASLLEQASGQDLFERFRDRIAAPLEMEDFTLDDTFSFLEPSRSSYPALIFRMSARDLARFGQLYLRKGEVEGRRILNPGWIDESWRPRTVFEEGSPYGAGNGFGYLWWVFPRNENAEWEIQRSASIFMMHGAESQLLAIVPEMNLVVVHQTDTENGISGRLPDAMRLVSAIAAARAGGVVQGNPETTAMRVESLPGAKPAPERLKAKPWNPGLIAAVVGDYRLNPEVVIRVHAVEGRVYALPIGAPLAEVEMFPADGNRIFSPVIDLRLELVRSPEDAIVALKGIVNGRPAEAARVP